MCTCEYSKRLRSVSLAAQVKPGLVTNVMSERHPQAMIRFSIFIIAATLPAWGAEGGRQPYTEAIPGTLIKFDMVPVPGGTFTMSDPKSGKPGPSVTVKPLWIGKTEVTWDA